MNIRKVLFTGSRYWRKEYRPAVCEVLDQLETLPSVQVVVGDCPSGVDKIVWEECLQRGMNVPVEVADWSKGGGPDRNSRMVAMRPDLCIAVHNDYQASKGTKDCASKAIKAGITTILMPRNIEFNLSDYDS